MNSSATSSSGNASHGHYPQDERMSRVTYSAAQHSTQPIRSETANDDLHCNVPAELHAQNVVLQFLNHGTTLSASQRAWCGQLGKEAPRSCGATAGDIFA